MFSKFYARQLILFIQLSPTQFYLLFTLAAIPLNQQGPFCPKKVNFVSLKLCSIVGVILFNIHSEYLPMLVLKNTRSTPTALTDMVPSQKGQGGPFLFVLAKLDFT